jgi:hypothetical protein
MAEYSSQKVGQREQFDFRYICGFIVNIGGASNGVGFLRQAVR